MAPEVDVGKRSPDVVSHEKSRNVLDAQQAMKQYDDERNKRLRDESTAQFIDISLSPEFARFQDDPWVDPAEVREAKIMFPNNRCRVLILGAGWGGILYAVRMIEAGVHPEYIRVIDPAGGWGGTWYWNRYPGLMCDIESYCYLPLLEETGYVPKNRYAYGEEIRNYANLVAKKWGIANSAVFQTRATKMVWDEAAKDWQVELVQQRKGEPEETLNIRSTFVAPINGVLNWPHLPGSPGILDYRGTTFHTSRWDYSFTGGSPADDALTKLQDKRVAIVGTGATAVQVVPSLARWSKHLYIIQRTPSAVDHRGQRKTDPDWFHREVATSQGWQRERHRNFHKHFTTAEKPAINLVDDEWTRATALVAIAGNSLGPRTVEEVPEYIKKLHAIDLLRQNRIRERVSREVHDKNVAKKLQPWYPSWCKRQAFHDDYLAAFNQENVTLLDTDCKDPDCITADSIVVNGQAYPVDAIIFATGFRSPFAGSPAERANMTILGRNGVSMSEEWARDGPSTLHGVLDHNFPNLFLSGPWQASTSPNFVFNLDQLAKHCAYILTEAERSAGGKPFAVTSTAAAVGDWGNQVMMHALPMAPMAGCTPSYFNLEGALDRLPPELQMQVARSGVWGHGIEDYLDRLEKWRAEGRLQGVDVQT